MSTTRHSYLRDLPHQHEDIIYAAASTCVLSSYVCQETEAAVMNRQSGAATIARRQHHVPASQHKSLQTPPYFIDLESLLLGNAV